MIAFLFITTPVSMQQQQPSYVLKIDSGHSEISGTIVNI